MIVNPPSPPLAEITAIENSQLGFYQTGTGLVLPKVSVLKPGQESFEFFAESSPALDSLLASLGFKKGTALLGQINPLYQDGDVLYTFYLLNMQDYIICVVPVVNMAGITPVLDFVEALGMPLGLAFSAVDTINMLNFLSTGSAWIKKP